MLVVMYECCGEVVAAMVGVCVTDSSLCVVK